MDSCIPQTIDRILDLSMDQIIFGLEYMLLSMYYPLEYSMNQTEYYMQSRSDYRLIRTSN